jgi:hypothetical protein
LLFIPFFRREKGFWSRAVVFVISTFIVAAPIGLYFVKNPADFFLRMSQLSITDTAKPILVLAHNLAKTALMFNIHGDASWLLNVSGAPELFLPVGIIFLIGIVWGLYTLWPGRGPRKGMSTDNVPLNFSLLLVFSWIVLGALPAVASGENIPHALRSILMLPPAIILAALGGIWTYRFIERRTKEKIAVVIGILFLASVAIFAYVDYFIIWAENPNVPVVFDADYVQIGHEINALPASTPKYVVIERRGLLTRGIPLPAETTMFITDSFTARTQEARNIHYLLPNEVSEIPLSAAVFYIR